MQTDIRSPGVSKAVFWASCVVSAIPVLLLFMSAGMKLSKNPQAVEGFAKGGYPDWSLVTLGVVELACTIIYLIPQTSVLGAILLTGYLGGAVDVHVRGSEIQFLAPFFCGVFVWLGLFLREPRLRVLIPFRR